MQIRTRISFQDELNPQQLRAVTAGPGTVLVLAGAGSGKTRTITYRVAYLIESGVEPHRILLLTFTNKAAREMLHRVEDLVPCDVKKLWGGTFHHVANRILRIHGQRLGFSPNYTILDQDDAHGLLNACLRELGHAKKEGVMPQGAALANMISLARNMRCGLEQIIDERYPFFLDYTEDIQAVSRLYAQKKKSLNVLDFDDLLCLWLALMEGDPGLRDYYSRRFEHILIDEYQDTNALQSAIIDVLGSQHGNVMAVGDDSQSIYAFRGASFANIIGFPQRHPETQICKLEYNYRSAPEILWFANHIIAQNQRQFRKILQPTRPRGLQPVLFRPKNALQQAQFVATRIQQYIYNGVPRDEIAVLYRAHYHSMELQMELTRRSVPFAIRSGIRFFEQAHIKDLVAYVRVMTNPRDEMAWKRILQLLPGLGQKSSDKLFAHMAGTADPLRACCGQEILRLVPKTSRPYWQDLCAVLENLARQGGDAVPGALTRTAFEGGYGAFMRSKYAHAFERGEDIEKFIEFAGQYQSVQDFLSELALMTSTLADDANPAGEDGKVKLSSIHQAKGLEWSVVFIIWLAEGYFPNARNFQQADDEEEDRRLFYVAVTRAKDELQLCAPVIAKDSGGYASVLPISRYLREVPEECYTKIDTPSELLRYHQDRENDW